MVSRTDFRSKRAFLISLKEEEKQEGKFSAHWETILLNQDTLRCTVTMTSNFSILETQIAFYLNKLTNTHQHSEITVKNSYVFKQDFWELQLGTCSQKLISPSTDVSQELASISAGIVLI